MVTLTHIECGTLDSVIFRHCIMFQHVLVEISMLKPLWTYSTIIRLFTLIPARFRQNLSIVKKNWYMNMVIEIPSWGGGVFGEKNAQLNSERFPTTPIGSNVHYGPIPFRRNRPDMIPTPTSGPTRSVKWKKLEKRAKIHQIHWILYRKLQWGMWRSSLPEGLVPPQNVRITSNFFWVKV